MGDVILEFSEYMATFGEKFPKRILASKQAQNLMKEKNIDIDAFAKSLKDFAEKENLVWLYISKRYGAISVDLSFNPNQSDS